ncbi:MAG TPA: transketolase C-terminal domain-containing protein [Syntrophales bacterium]|nr:transketolase C-terminal domain-containing protein [Syntrophales bacterium]
MAKRVGMEVAIAAAEAVALCRIDVAAVYPITPNTHIAEHLAEIVADGRLDAEYITVESEHSSISACCGASGAGARAYTATSSQGLMLMHEILPIVSAMRLPVVMGLANRAVSGPLNIWNDHSDIMPQRDSGWISFFAENGQEAVDMSIQSFRIAEDPEVMLPIVLNIDGFQLTHMIEALELPSQKEVDRYLPPFRPLATLHPDKPVSMGAYALPDIFTEVMKVKDSVLIDSKKTILKAWDEWGKQFGRWYKPVETYKADGAEVLIMTMGSMGETASIAVDELRAKGVPAGLVKLRLWRPFPFEEFREAIKGAKVLIVCDRAVSFGGPGGPVAAEVKSALYSDAGRPAVLNFLIGLGGRDVTVENFKDILEKGVQAINKKPAGGYIFYGVRE